MEIRQRGSDREAHVGDPCGRRAVREMFRQRLEVSGHLRRARTVHRFIGQELRRGVQVGAGPARLPLTRNRQVPCVGGDGSSSGPHSFAKLELLADDDIDPNRRLAEVIERTEATHPSNNILLLLIN